MTRYNHHTSKPAGPCPKCGVQTRTTGLATPETRGRPRLVASRNQCTGCDYRDRNPNAIPKNKKDPAIPADFEWTPELLQDAVAHALTHLDDGLEIA
jgi:hypothetical protein